VKQGTSKYTITYRVKFTADKQDLVVPESLWNPDAR
jgi:hypothetical protein